MKKFITWVLSAIMSLSPATAATTNTTEAAKAVDTAIVAEAATETGTEDGADKEASADAPAADDKDYDALMNAYASEVQNWTYLEDENVWVIPVNTEAPADKPEGEAPADGETPEKPDGEAPTDGEAPAKPDGETPEKPDGAPKKPEGEASGNSEAPADLPNDADQKGAAPEGDALPLQGIPGDLVLGVDTDSDGTVDVTAENYTESVMGVLIWADGAELTELITVE